MRVCILTTEYSLATNIALEKLLNHKKIIKNNIEIVGVLSTNHVNILRINTWKKLIKFIQTSGIIFAIKTIAINTWQKLNLKIVRYLYPRSQRKIFEVSELCEQHNIPYFAVDSINNSSSKKIIKDLDIDTIVSCLLLEKVDTEVLSMPINGAINFHPALFKDHRGTFSGFWALLNRKKYAGATVHFMTQNFDEGEIITQRKFFIRANDSMNCINEKSSVVGGVLLAKALVKIEKRNIRTQQIKKWSPLLSMPNVKQANLFRKYHYIMRRKDFWRS